MGDSGALLLGFTLASVSVEGMLKTAALATLVLPLLVLAVPLDRHVVRRREAAQARPPIYRPTATTCTTASRTSASRTAARSSTSTPGARRSRSRPSRRASSIRTRTATGTSPSTAIDAVVGLLALGASVYVVYLLEIVKLANPFIRRREEQERGRSRATLGVAVATKSARLRAGRAVRAVTNSGRRVRYAPADGAGRAPLVSPCPGGRDADRADRRRDRRRRRSSAGPPGSAKDGLIVGAVSGVPAGIAGVYCRYRGYFCA